jgi:WD40 repeat protein
VAATFTASTDRTARVWDVASGEMILELKGHRGQVYAAFSPDGTRIVTWSSDGTARVWDVSWTTIRGAELVRRTCAAKLAGAETFTEGVQRFLHVGRH